MGNAGQFHEGLVLFAIFTAIGLGFLFLDRWYRRALAAKGRWPTVEGTIISASLKKVLRGTGVYGPYTHVPEVRNQYVVDGQRYEGNRVGYGDWGILDAAEARKLLKSIPSRIDRPGPLRSGEAARRGAPDPEGDRVYVPPHSGGDPSVFRRDIPGRSDLFACRWAWLTSPRTWKMIGACSP